MNKINFDHPLAIVINNTCNLTCNNCGTAQCYNFKGVFRWDETAHLYEKWSSLIDIPNIEILGGEPYLNPDLLEWTINIKKLWSNSRVGVISNGTLLNIEKHIDTTRKFLNNQITLMVCTHSLEDYNKHADYILKILEPYINEIEIVYDKNEKFTRYIKNSQTLISHKLVDEMYRSYFKEVKDGVMYLSDSDPVKSHENCIWAQNCFTIQKGLLYKCPLVTNYAEAKTQVKYEQRATDLLEKYKACSPFDQQTQIEKFINDLPKVIPQCSLCPFDKMPNAKEQLFPVTFNKEWKKAFKGV